jgi:uncharacterized protein (TIGR03437 family)
VQNPASNILPGLPDFGIAPGSIMVVYGANFATTTAEPPFPLPTSYAGVSLTIAQGSTTANAPIIAVVNPDVISLPGPPVSYNQLAAVMPSNILPGTANFQLTYNGVAGNVFSTTVLANNFGVSTNYESARTQAILTYPTSSFPYYRDVTIANSAIPGNTYAMWGTGLGAATGGNSDTNVNVYGNVGPPVTVLVGGISAAVTYYGRSPGAEPGLDQINFTIPAGLSGCAVSLVVEIAGTPPIFSNNATIPIAANGGTCSDSIGLPSGTWPPLLALPGGVNLAWLTWNQTTTVTYPTPIFIAVASESTNEEATFGSLTQDGFASDYIGIFNPDVSAGSCIVTISYKAYKTDLSTVAYTAEPSAGAAVTFTPPSGSPATLESGGTDSYQATVMTLLPSGPYTVSNGSGGANVGPVSANFTVPPFIAWTNQNTLSQSTVTRANGVTVTWTGGTSAYGGYADIQGSAPFRGTNGSASNSVFFECTAPISAGTFTVPPSVLLAMPAVGGSLQVGNNFDELIAMPGINLAVASGSNATSVPVTWE